MSNQTNQQQTQTDEVLRQAQQAGENWDQLVADVKAQGDAIRAHSKEVDKLVEDTNALLRSLGVDPTSV